MNLRTAFLLLALVIGSLLPARALAQSTTGTVTAFSRETGQLTVVPGGSHRPVHLRDMKRAVYLYGSGRRASFDNLQEGQVITVEYVRRGDRWYVGKVVLPNPTDRPYPAMPPGGLDVATRRASTSRAASDRDITTQPGSKARFDGDRTTQPGTTDPRTNTDITKRPDNR
jgi:hypothetical protein